MRPTPFEVELVDQSISRGPEVNQDKAAHTQLYIIIFFGGHPLITLLLTAVLHLNHLGSFGSPVITPLNAAGGLPWTWCSVDRMSWRRRRGQGMIVRFVLVCAGTTDCHASGRIVHFFLFPGQRVTILQQTLSGTTLAGA